MQADDDALKAAIERPETILLYGVPRERTPVLVSKVFGDGAKLVELTPVNTIPDVHTYAATQQIANSIAKFISYFIHNFK